MKISMLRMLLVLIPITFCLSGCFDEHVLIKVKKDGSGYVERNSYNNFDAMMGGFMAGFEEEGASQPDQMEKYDEAFFNKQAASMGEGVALKEFKLGANASGFKGYQAVYTFEDINKLEIVTEAGDDESAQASDMDSDALATHHSFSMKDGELIIYTPEPDVEEAEKAQKMSKENEQAAAQMMAMMGAMFRGARVKVEVEALDSIKSTNARHVDGNRITLFDVRLDELMSNPELLTKAQNLNVMSREDAQAAADQIKGIDIDAQAEIKVRF